MDILKGKIKVSRKEAITTIRQKITKIESKTMEKINKSKSWFFERTVNKLWPGSGEDQVDPSKQSIKVTNGISPTEIQKILRESPVQVPCKIQDAWGWCIGMTQRDGMGREVGGGSGLGTRVHPWWIHVDVWQNQYNIVK